MATVTGYVSGPYQGVSQAPPQVALPGTCRVMEDCLAVLPQGVQKRPPFTWVKDILPGLTDPEDSLIGEIPRGSPSADVTLILCKVGGVVTPKLFDTATMTAIACSVSGAATSYLNTGSPNPARDLKFSSVEDVTFVTNRLVPVALSGDLAPARPFEALVWVKTGGYARTFQVTVSPSGGTPVTSGFATSTGASAADVLATGTDRIALALYDHTDPSVGHDNITGSPLTDLTSQGFTVEITGAVIYIAHPTLDFQITIQDDQGGTGMTAIKGTVQRFSDLPALAHEGFTVRIAQAAAGQDSDYFVEFKAASATTVGYWSECLEPETPLGLNPLTMPIGITNTGGVWACDTLPWTGRTTGNPTLSPDPNFVGDYCTDVRWWRGRLGILANGSIHLSASDSPYKFYTTTLAASLASDPIGFLTPFDQKSFFREAGVFDQRLILFGDKTQAIVSTNGAVTAENARIDPLSTTAYTDQMPVQGVAHKVYFMALRSSSAVIYEMGIDRLSGLALPEDLSPGVPTYLPATLDRVASHATDYLTVRGSSGRDRLIVHSFRYADNERVQNAFYGWNLPIGYTLAGMFVTGTILVTFLVNPSGALSVCTQDLTPDRVDPSGSYLTHLDLRVTEAQCTSVSYDATLNRTTFTLPIPVQTNLIKAVVRAPAVGTDYLPGYVPSIIGANSTTVVLQGNWSSHHLYFGNPYRSYFTPTRFYKMGQDGKPEHSGRLTMARAKADLADWGYLRIEVAIKGRPTKTVLFEGTFQDDPLSQLDTAPDFADTVLSFPIGGNAEDTNLTFINDSHLGFKLTGLEWEGSWTPKARRVT